MIVNGATVGWHKPTISYAEIAHMVGKGAPGVNPSVTYRLPDNVGGTLSRGDVIAVSDVLVINAYVTGGA